MVTEPAALARNTGYFTLALVGQKVISFAYFTFLARLLGPAEVGKYVFALSFAAIFSVLLDLGLASVLVRELARAPERAERYLKLVLGLKVVLSLAVVAAAVYTIGLLGYPQLTRQLVYLACAVMLFDSFTLTAYSALRGFHTLVWESLGSILMQATVAVGGVVVSFYTHDVRVFMVALIFAAGVNLFFSYWQLRHRFQLRFRPGFNRAGFIELFHLAWPFTLAALLMRVYSYVDTVILSLLSGDRAVGIYSLAYKITYALQFIPTAFSASLYPGFSTFFLQDKEKLADTFIRGVRYLVAIATPITFGVIGLAPELVRSMYPAFHESVLPLQVLMASLPFLFVTFPVGALLPACNRQPRNTANLGMAATATVVLNLILVPRLGPLGASIAAFLSTLMLLVLGWIVARRLIVYNAVLLWSRLARIIFSGVVMLLLVLWLKTGLHFLLVIPLAALCYMLLLVGSGGVQWDELVSLVQVFKKKIIPGVSHGN